MLRRDCRDLDHRLAEVAAEHPQAAFGGERAADGTQYIVVGGLGEGGLIDEPGASASVVHCQRLRVRPHAAPHHGLHVVVHKTRREQFPKQKGSPSHPIKVVHIGIAIGVEARQQWRHARQRINVLPGEFEARRLGNRYPVHRVIGRSAGR